MLYVCNLHIISFFIENIVGIWLVYNMQVYLKIIHTYIVSLTWLVLLSSSWAILVLRHYFVPYPLNFWDITNFKGCYGAFDTMPTVYRSGLVKIIRKITNRTVQMKEWLERSMRRSELEWYTYMELVVY